MKRNVKIVLIVLGCVFGTIILLGIVGSVVGMAGQDEVRAFRLPAVDMGRIKDGVYDGACGIGRFALAVKVTVKDHRVVDITLAESGRSNISRKLETELQARILHQETPSFDAVSGASITGKAYFIAVTDALQKGMQ